MIRNINIKVLICFLVFTIKLFGAYHKNFPITLNQPNGVIINCLMTGDEFYHWLHDSNNYTIKQDTLTGFYCYATIVNSELVASSYIVGQINPASVGLTPNINITSQQIYNITNAVQSSIPARIPLFNSAILSTQGTKTLNNLVVYIRFADDQNSEFPANQESYNALFNDSTIGNKSVLNYFKEMMYNKTNIITTFYPTNNGASIISYKDIHTRNYYLPKSTMISYNPPKFNVDSGYPPNDQNGLYRERREMELIRNALNNIKSMVPASLNLDVNEDGNIDNICFIIRGIPIDRDTPLYGHQGEYVPYNNYIINSKYVKKYNFVMESEVNNTGTYVLCHEMLHTFGAPDLYHYTEQNFKPVNSWDIMSCNNTIHSGAYIRYKYLKWITDIPTITQSGHYSLQPITSSTNNCLKILSSNPNEYFILEFRQKNGTFESAIPATGLLVYRINTSVNCFNGIGGNACGPPDEVYVYRPYGTITNNGNINNANFDTSLGRGIFNSISNPNSFLSDGSVENIAIKNITVNGNIVSFDIRLCTNSDITLSNTNQIPEVINAVNTIQTSGSVTVKSTDNITFEAGQEINLNAGFEVQQGGQLNVRIIQCGN